MQSLKAIFEKSAHLQLINWLPFVLLTLWPHPVHLLLSWLINWFIPRIAAGFDEGDERFLAGDRVTTDLVISSHQLAQAYFAFLEIHFNSHMDFILNLIQARLFRLLDDDGIPQFLGIIDFDSPPLGEAKSSIVNEDDDNIPDDCDSLLVTKVILQSNFSALNAPKKSCKVELDISCSCRMSLHTCCYCPHDAFLQLVVMWCFSSVASKFIFSCIRCNDICF
nr:hypothetical protein CFP56_51384 [Quercus suber]